MTPPFRLYIDGRWIEPSTTRSALVIDPASEGSIGELGFAGLEDVDQAVRAARRAFDSYSHTALDERLRLLRRVLSEYERRSTELAVAITADMGAPVWLAEQAQAAAGLAHLKIGIQTLERYRFSELVGPTRLDRVPVGVCALMTSWNWPIDQIACKVVPALAVGCTVVLKPSERAPASAQVWAQILDASGVPAGVFNLVAGDEVTAAALSAHPDVDMVSITGSTRAGIEVARAAAPTVKRVCQRLSGKSANIILDDAELGEAIPAAVHAVCLNSGQSAHAPTRLLVPVRAMDDVMTLARAAAERVEVGTPASNAVMGPVASAEQWRRIQAFIRDGIAEGATLVAGGLGKPNDLPRGYYVKPTLFANVTHEMKIAREAVLGPVLAIMGYHDEEQAIHIANDTAYGLAGYVQSSDPSRAARVAARLRVGHVAINGTSPDCFAPCGGFKHSGNGREWGEYGFADYLELRAITGSALARAHCGG